MHLAPLKELNMVWLFQGAPPLKFAIFFAGALIRDRNLSYIYKEKVTLPSIHIIGDKDYVKEASTYMGSQTQAQPVITIDFVCLTVCRMSLCIITSASTACCIRLTWPNT